MRIWVPYEDWRDLPARHGLDAEVGVYPGRGELPGAPDPTLEQVEVYVVPYLYGVRPIRLARDMPRLRVMQTLTAGVDDYLAELPDGVQLCNARGVHDASTAELAVTLTLAALRGIPEFVRAHRDGRWAHEHRPSLADRTVLVVGYGAVGAAVERRLAGFECEVTRVARSARTCDAGPVEAFDALPRLLPAADVVVLTVPLTDETRGMVDAAFLASMPDGALLVNVSRGPVVRSDALLAEVRSGRLRAALDVTDPEPLPPDHELWRLPGVLVSPHVGGDTSAFLPRAERLVADQLTRFAAGRPLRNVVTGTY